MTREHYSKYEMEQMKRIREEAEKLLHVGVVTDHKRGGYLITAEYRSGYLILGYFKTAEEAKAALPKVKRAFRKKFTGGTHA
jgi:hypothetical protein